MQDMLKIREWRWNPGRLTCHIHTTSRSCSTTIGSKPICGAIYEMPLALIANSVTGISLSSSGPNLDTRIIWERWSGHVLIYIHKEQMLDDVARRYPAGHYVLVDDKLRILGMVKQIWQARVTNSRRIRSVGSVIVQSA